MGGIIGLDPKPYTLRKLKWMADGKRAHDFDLSIHLILSLGESIAGTFSPVNSNPFRPNYAELLKSENRKKQESDVGWKLLDRFMYQLAGKRMPKNGIRR